MADKYDYLKQPPPYEPPAPTAGIYTPQPVPYQPQSPYTQPQSASLPQHLALQSPYTHQPQAVGHQPQAVGHQPQAVGHQPQAVGHQPQAAAAQSPPAQAPPMGTQQQVILQSPTAQPQVFVLPQNQPKQQVVPDNVNIAKSKLGGKPAVTTCRNCRQRMQTNVNYKSGCFAWGMCILLFWIGLFFGPCLIPFFVKKCKDAHHYCSLCNTKLCVHKPCC